MLNQSQNPIVIKERIGAVAFDSSNGIGKTDLISNNLYAHVLIYLLPKTFLDLVSLRQGWPNYSNVGFLEEAIKTQTPIAPPYFIISKNNENSWFVTAHEGRTRTEIIHDIQPDLPIPVYVFCHSNADNFSQHELIQAFHHPLTNQDGTEKILVMNNN